MEEPHRPNALSAVNTWLQARTRNQTQTQRRNTPSTNPPQPSPTQPSSHHPLMTRHPRKNSKTRSKNPTARKRKQKQVKAKKRTDAAAAAAAAARNRESEASPLNDLSALVQENARVWKTVRLERKAWRAAARVGVVGEVVRRRTEKGGGGMEVLGGGCLGVGKGRGVEMDGGRKGVRDGCGGVMDVDVDVNEDDNGAVDVDTDTDTGTDTIMDVRMGLDTNVNADIDIEIDMDMDTNMDTLTRHDPQPSTLNSLYSTGVGHS